MMITDDLVEYLEELGKIHLNPDEKAQTKRGSAKNSGIYGHLVRA